MATAELVGKNRIVRLSPYCCLMIAGAVAACQGRDNAGDAPREGAGQAQVRKLRQVRPGVFCGEVASQAPDGKQRFEMFVYVQPEAVRPGDERDIGPHAAQDPANLPSTGFIPGTYRPLSYGAKYGCPPARAG